MTAWVYTADQVTSGQLVLKDEIVKPAYAGMTDEAVAASINAQTEADDSPVDLAAVRRKAIEERVWGKLLGFSTRAFVTTAATQTLTDACKNFMSLFSEPEGTVSLVRGGALWNAMDADLTLMTGSAGGGPVLTAGQASYMRSLGDRLRQKWSGGVGVTDVPAARAL